MYRKTILVFLLIVMLTLNGCMGNRSDGVLKELGPNEKITLKVMSWDEPYFMNTYGSLLLTKYPNIQIEVISTQPLRRNVSRDPYQLLSDYIDEYQPDVLQLSRRDYEYLVEKNQLYRLDPVIKQDNFDLEGIHPAILNILRDKGNGDLYGLSPEFYSAALYYNVDLFRMYGVEPPGDSMSWEEVLNLAQRFSRINSESHIYGLTFDDRFAIESYFTLITEIGGTENLTIFSQDNKQLILNSKSWNRIFQMVVDASKNNNLQVPDLAQIKTNSWEQTLKQNKFIMGESAMIIAGSPFVNILMLSKEDISNGTLDSEAINWGIVTDPVDPNNRQQSDSFSIGDIYSVNAYSPNLRAAWEIVKYINGEEYARLKSKTPMVGALSSRMDYSVDQDGHSMEPFYKLDPKPMSVSKEKMVPLSFWRSFPTLFNDEIAKVINGQKDLGEAISTIQSKGQEILDQAHQEAKINQQ